MKVLKDLCFALFRSLEPIQCEGVLVSGPGVLRFKGLGLICRGLEFRGLGFSGLGLG